MLLTLACFAIFYAVVRLPVFRPADQVPNPGRVRMSTIDGLRGVLALAVLVHHAAMIRSLARTGHWGVGVAPFIDHIGPTGVAGFFMITGFLFTGILLREDGRPNWLRLYAGRILRIGPLYLLAVVLMLAVVAARTGFTLHETPAALSREIGRWLALGVFLPVPVNGYGTTLLLGVAWTLHFEWCFYAALPLLALAARGRRAPLLLSAALVVAVVLAHRRAMDGYQPTAAAAALMFLIGALAASLRRAGFRLKLPDRLASLLVLLFLALALRRGDAFAPHTTLPLGAAFVLVANGTGVFGLLHTSAARRMGDLSYGIYLLHLFVFALLGSVPVMRDALAGSPLEFWLFTIAAGSVVLLVSCASFVLLERPGIALGRRLFEPAPAPAPQAPMGGKAVAS